MTGPAIDARKKMMEAAKVHKCKDCNAKYRSIGGLYSHRRRRHVDTVEVGGVVVKRSTDGLFHCPTCPSAAYMNPDGLEMHIRGRQHLAPTRKWGGFVRRTDSVLQFLVSCPTLAFHSQLRLLMCVPCGYSVTKKDAVSHVQRLHSTLVTRPYVIRQELKQLPIAEIGRGPLPPQEYLVEGLEWKDGKECPDCSSLFVSARMVRKHVKLVHDGKPIKMTPCVVQSIGGGNRARYFKIRNPPPHSLLGTVEAITKPPSNLSRDNALQEMTCERRPPEALRLPDASQDKWGERLGVPNSIFLLRIALTQLLVRTGQFLRPSTGIAPASGPSKVQVARQGLALPPSVEEPSTSVMARNSGSSSLASFLSPEQGMAALAALHTEGHKGMDVLAVLPPYDGKSMIYLLTTMLEAMDSTILVVVPNAFAVEAACDQCVDAGFVCGQWAPAEYLGVGPIPTSTPLDGRGGGISDGINWRQARPQHNPGTSERRSSSWGFARLIVVDMSDVATPSFEKFFRSNSNDLHRVVVDDLHALDACTALRPKFSQLIKLVRAAEINFLCLSSWLSAYTERELAPQKRVLRIQQPVLLHQVGFRVLIVDEDANMDTLILRKVRGFMADAKDDERMAIFTMSDVEAMSLAERLRSSPSISESVACVTFHGQRRDQHNMMGEWKQGKRLILVCPSFVSFGLHHHNLTQVVHRGSSPSLVAFAHGCGRAGRGDGKANCWLVSSSQYLRERQDKSDLENEVIHWARDRENCRRQQLHLASSRVFARHCFFDDSCQPCDVCMTCGETASQ